MKREEILRTAFTIAISNGWQATLDGKMLRRIGRDGKPWSWTGASTWGSKDLIFGHEFVRALWGTDEADDDLYQLWEFHLREMVIAPDPIRYLGDNLPSETKS